MIMASDLSEKLEEAGSSGNLNLQGDTDHENSDQNLTEKDLEKGEDANRTAEDEPIPAAAPAQDAPPKDPNLIDWDGPDDPENPMNWSRSKKWITTTMLGIVTFCVTFASSVFSNATFITAEEYHVSTEVTTLGTSLFVLGFAIGPMVSIFLPSTRENKLLSSCQNYLSC
jgi:DHA1 family multidrug resistance protein-like MFS transporter